MHSSFSLPLIGIQHMVSRTHPTGYLYLKRKGKSGKTAKNAGKRHHRRVCTATFLGFLEVISLMIGLG